MSRYYWRKFAEDYAKLRERIDRDYGQRAYGDRLKVETTGMLKQEEPDYEIHFKPYPPQKQQKPATEILQQEDRENQEKIETGKTDSKEPIEVQDDFTPDVFENALEEAETEISQKKDFEPLDVADKEQLEPVEYPGDFISDVDIIKREKLRQLGHGNCNQDAGSDYDDASY